MFVAAKLDELRLFPRRDLVCEKALLCRSSLLANKEFFISHLSCFAKLREERIPKLVAEVSGAIPANSLR